MHCITVSKYSTNTNSGSSSHHR